MPANPDDARARRIAEAAERARAESEARRLRGGDPENRPAEIAGRKGPEPTRFGDWEKKGIASDF